MMPRYLWGHRVDRVTRPAYPDAVREDFHPLDHDRDGGKGGSTAHPGTDEITALRAEYFAKFEKRAWHGWGPDELRARISKA